MIQTHADQVTAQFGPRAAAYVASAVHASGADLEQLAAFAALGPNSARALDSSAPPVARNAATVSSRTASAGPASSTTAFRRRRSSPPARR